MDYYESFIQGTIIGCVYWIIIVMLFNVIWLIDGVKDYFLQFKLSEWKGTPHAFWVWLFMMFYKTSFIIAGIIIYCLV